MSVTDTGVGSGFDLSLDELSLLRDHLPGLVLPSFIRPTPARDEGAAFASLRRRELIDETTVLSESDWTARVAPAVMLSLALQMSGDVVFQITAWTATRVTAHSSTVTSGVASGLTALSARDDAGTGSSSPRIVARVAPVSVLSTWLAELVPSTDAMAAAPGGGSVTVGLVESRALIAAIRGGDPRVVDAVSADLSAPESRKVLGQLAGSIAAGFRAKVFTPSGGCVYSGDWFLGNAGWMKISLATSTDGDGRPTAQSIAESGTVTIAAVTPGSIEVELLSLVSEGVRDSYAERQA
jgi:hypothetical protein